MALDRRRYLALVGGAATIAGCASTGGQTDGTTTAETTTAETTTAAPRSGSVTVGMYTKGSDFYFDPVGVHVEPGTTVTFEVKSGGHSATSYSTGNPECDTDRIPDGAKPWNSSVLTETNATFDHAFETEGTYDYYCIPHKSLGMLGRIVVGSPGGPADGSMPPDGRVPTSDAIVARGTVSHADFTG